MPSDGVDAPASPVARPTRRSAARPNTPRAPATLLDILERSANLSERRGIYVLDGRGGQEFRTYSQILTHSLRAAAAMEARGVASGDRLLVVQPTGFDFITHFLGASFLGALPVPLALPREENANTPGHAVAEIVRLGQKFGARHALVTPAEQALLAQPARRRHFQNIWDSAALMKGVDLDARPEGALCWAGNAPAYIQCTSGTMGSRRGALITHENILANVQAVGKALDVRDGDVAVSWLPLHHIMGLVGVVFFSMAWGMDAVLLEPERFLRRPEDWLWAISDFRGTLSAAPNFAFHYCVRRCKESNLEGLDLSTWRVAMNGSESVRVQHMEAFARRMRRHGLAESIFLPVYGLSEATLGVTFGSLGEGCVVDGINRTTLARHGLAEPLPPQGAPTPEERMHVVSVGKPLEGLEVRVVDAQGEPVAERVCGEVAVRGSTVMAGYVEEHPEARTPGGALERAPDLRATRLEGDWLHTGDLGYMADGRLFLIGRRHDAVTTPDGRRMHADEVEFFVNSVDGVRSGSATVFEAPRPAREIPEMVVAFELQAGSEAPETEAAVRELLQRHLALVPDTVLGLPSRTVPKTRTGKPRRFLARQLYVEGQLGRRQSFQERAFEAMPQGLHGVRQNLEAGVHTALSFLRERFKF